MAESRKSVTITTTVDVVFDEAEIQSALVSYAVGKGHLPHGTRRDQVRFMDRWGGTPDPISALTLRLSKTEAGE